MDRRALLAGSAAGLWAASARAQQACFDRLDCFDTQLPGPSLDLQFTAGALDPRITFTRASVATYFDVAGTLQSAASGAPRFDYDPVTHAAKGLLIEEARTNLLLNSATLGTQSVTVTAAATTLSFYGTGTVTLSGTFAGSLVGSGVFPTRSTLTFTPTAGSLTCTVTGSVLNAQVETGAFATSWISTTGTTATRAADVASMPVGSWFKGTANSVVAEADAAATGGIIYSLTDGGGAANRLQTALAAMKPATTLSSGSVNALANPETGTVTAGTAFKFGSSLVAGSYMSSLNGAAPFVSTTGIVMPAGVTQLALGLYVGGNILQLNGHLRRVRYWPRALSGPELQAVTR